MLGGCSGAITHLAVSTSDSSRWVIVLSALRRIKRTGLDGASATVNGSPQSSATLKLGQFRSRACDSRRVIRKNTMSVSNSLSGGDRELDEVPAVGDPAHGAQSARSSCVHRRKSPACVPSMTRRSVPRCSRPRTRQASVPDHEHSRAAHGRGILAASCRSSAPRMGGTGAHAVRSC
jgi:hypothetical protein